MRGALRGSFLSMSAALALAGCGGSSTPPAPTCTDGVRNGAETGLDCGGATCPRCAAGGACVQDSDCASGVCVAGACAAPTCVDGVRNGAETAVDCGGGACPTCADNVACAQASDCQSGVCFLGQCRAPSCADGVKNGSETATDCGGGTCPTCADGRACQAAADCLSGVCSSGTSTCAAPSCADGVRNGAETGVDCGGICPGCGPGGPCALGSDCGSGVCQVGTCRVAACGNGVSDASETDVDCGGPDCAPCATGKACGMGTDCASAVCQTGLCRPAHCGNGAKDADETDADCGGSCTPCAAGKGCATGADCASGACGAGTCLEAPGATCLGDAQCASGFCTDGVCCDVRCGGICQACNQVGSVGTCAFLPAGTPYAACPNDGQATCGRTGLCSGAGSCALYSAGTACVPASCASATSANRVDSCDGSGTCVDGGVVACTPYVCNGASGTCRTTCTADADCAPGYACSSGVCKVSVGGLCSFGAQCSSGACCSGVCRDLATDADNCGACGTVCHLNAGTSANACTSGTCAPTCNGAWGNCDGNGANGCETPLDTLTDCGACGAACSLANADASCGTGTCELASCNIGYASCDGSSATGCETPLSGWANTCGTAQDLGSTCGDTYYPSGWLCAACSPAAYQTLSTSSGTQGSWFHVRVLQCTAGSACGFPLGTINARMTLSVPQGVDYDLYVYSACGTLLSSSTNGAGTTEQVVISNMSFFGSYDLWIEVRFSAGSSCSTWTLTVEGTNIPAC